MRLVFNVVAIILGCAAWTAIMAAAVGMIRELAARPGNEVAIYGLVGVLCLINAGLAGIGPDLLGLLITTRKPCEKS